MSPFPPGGLETLQAFITSLAIGLLIGLERERSPAAKAGLRTFTLVALFGTLCAMLATATGFGWFLAAGLIAVAMLIVTAYFGAPAAEGDPGTTTEIALLVCYGLGAVIWYGYTTLAIMLAIFTTMLLYFKPELRGLSQRLERRDLLSILQFGVLSFVILPILPNQAYGPYDALNPYHIWLMVVLLSGINLSGYVALRLVGQRYGAPLLGILGGLVSSTATTLIYARHGKTDENPARLAVPVILLASLVVIVRLGVIGATVAPTILPHLLPVLGGGLALGLLATAYAWRKLSTEKNPPMPTMKNPAKIGSSITLGLVYGVVLFLTAWLSDYAGSKGLYAVAVVSGLTDVDPITLSSLRLYTLARLQPEQVVTAITLALVANLVFKFGLVAFIGGPALARRCFPGMLAIALGALAALML